jgi:hypothetical protein
LPKVARNLSASLGGDSAGGGGRGSKAPERRATASGGSGLNQGGLGYKFMASLIELNALIATTGPHYVRCLKVRMTRRRRIKNIGIIF